MVTYDEPVLFDATGNPDGLTIPTRYNGDLVARLPGQPGSRGRASAPDYPGGVTVAAGVNCHQFMLSR